ncbi:unnamed protein product [Amoebophrya sp. A25]|nr:unnamed protein product [Amoebophrya sp. A25]|eukprot:GSA25T00017168001.1
MLHRRERTQSPRGGDRHVRMAPSAIISPSEADVEEITRLNITDSKDSPSVSTLGSPANGYDGSSQSGVPLGGQGEDTTMAMAGGATTWTHSTTGTHDEPEAQQQHLLGTSNPQREPNVVGALSSTPGYKRQRLTRMQRKTALGINVSINIEHGVPLSGKIVIIQEIDQYRGLTWIAWVLHLLSSTAIFLASYMWYHCCGALPPFRA